MAPTMALHLVTGGSGFVGSHTAQRLLGKGEDVRILDVAPPDVPGTDLRGRVDYVEADVRDRAAVAEATEGVDFVHHNVALVPLTKAGDRFWEVNVDGTRNVMEAALAAGVEGVSHVSSSAVYDISEMPVTEETPTDPIGRYGASKLEGDRVVLELAEEEGLPANVLRPRTVLDERRAGIYHILFDWVRQGKRVWMLGNGTNEFQLVSARDLAEASYQAAVADRQGEVYNVGNRDYNTLGEDLRHLVEHAGSSSSITWIPAGPTRVILQILDKLRLSPLAPWHYKTVYRDYWFDISKITSHLDWEPADGNHAMFERAYDWFLDHEIEEVDAEGSVHRTAPRERILGLLRRLS